ncbi:Uma2 family endonuclease [Gloeocapsa sp. BRSZ]
MTQALEQRTYTDEEYLNIEVTSEERHEYVNGEIRLMTGGTPNHNDIAGNLYVLLKLALKGKPYRTFYADQRLWIADRNLYTYPDVMVVPRPLQLQIGRNDTITNPVMIAEVLPKSTQDYDRGEKFVAYRTIDSFCEYLLIDQYSFMLNTISRLRRINGYFQNTKIPQLHYLSMLLIFKFKLLKFMKASILMLEI